jgi:hypothetical protein
MTVLTPPDKGNSLRLERNAGVVSSNTRSQGRGGSGVTWPVGLFMATLLFPPESGFMLGDLLLSPQRILLIWATLWCGFRLLSTPERLRLPDYLVVSHALWALLALSVVNGFGRGAKSGGIYVVESLGPYLLAREYVRNVWTFRGTVAMLVIVVVVTVFFTVPESISHRPILRDLFYAVVGGPHLVYTAIRHGLARAYGPFADPILYGVFCASSFGLAWYVLASERVWYLGRIGRSVFIWVGVIASVSSGPILATATQGLLIFWESLTRRFRNRWYWLVSTIGLFVAVVDCLSNRGVTGLMIAYGTLEPGTGGWRMLEWEYGSAEVRRHPAFGIGFGDWERPAWMAPSSIDSFWLATAMRFGLPCVTLLIGMIVALIVGVAMVRIVDVREQRCRLGYTTSIVGIAFAATTVHLWGSAFTWFFFLLGAGAWMLHSRHGRAAPSVPRMTRPRNSERAK